MQRDRLELSWLLSAFDRVLNTNTSILYHTYDYYCCHRYHHNYSPSL